MNTRTTHLHPVDGGDLESQIGDMLRTVERRPPPPVIQHAPPPMQDDIGRLSAEAVLAQYDHAAKCVEDLGNEIRERVRRLETQMKEAHDDLKLIANAADKIREKGKQVHIQIEGASQLSKDIRETCAEFVRKVGA